MTRHNRSCGEDVSFVGIEDLIADRMGQYNSAPRGVPAMRRQALALYLAGLEMGLDRDYLDRRIKDETLGDYDLSTLREWAERHAPDDD